MRRYESLVILDPEMADDDIVGFTERFSTLIKTTGGEIIKIEDWGSKKLAYLVKKRDKGRYILFDFVGVPSLITEMERQYKISEEVIKFLSVKLDDDVDLEAFKAAREKPAEPEPTEASTEEPPAEAPTDTPEQAAQETPAPEASAPEAAGETEVVATEGAPEAAPAEETAPGQAPPEAQSTETDLNEAPAEASPQAEAAEAPASSESSSDDTKEGV
ncbi:MAG: 30S ribosomal protein S6 [Pseudomonadota bacterium]